MSNENNAQEGPAQKGDAQRGPAQENGAQECAAQEYTAQGGGAQGGGAQRGGAQGGSFQGGGAQGGEPYVEQTEEGLRIGCFNAHSMLKAHTKKDRLKEIKELINIYQFHIFVIVETWLKSVYQETGLKHIRKLDGIEIDKYSCLNHPRQFGKQGYGGILIYIHNALVTFTDMTICEKKVTEKVGGKVRVKSIQLIVIRITQPFQLNLVTVYNPHKKHTDTLYQLLGECLNSLATNTENVVVLGDFNIDLNPKNVGICKINRNKLTDPYKLEERIKSATFIESKTHIDHIYSSQDRTLTHTHCGDIHRVRRSLHVEAGVIEAEISDHYPIFGVLAEQLICLGSCNQTFVNISALREHQKTSQCEGALANLNI